MGQTLPHGVYLPDNGERNCYTGLSQNWQKLDNLIGSHGDTVSFAQTLTEGVEIGKITINGEEVSLYHTDYSGKADADNVYTKAEIDTSLNAKQDALSNQQIANINDVTNKANDSNVVHLTGNETVSGIKTFTNNIVSTTSVGAPILKNGFMQIWGLSNTMIFRQFDVNGNLIDFTINRQRDVCLPNGSLGTSSAKWKSINGINPGALGLPNHNSYLDLKGNFLASVSDDSWTTRYQITPEQDGILIIQLNNCSGVVVWNNINLPSYGERGTSICIEKRVMAPVIKGVTYNIVTSNYSQVVIARLFYCQGNV